MTKFVKSEFSPGEYAHYNGKFVARFKRGHRGSFLTFLCKNFTVEEYFSRLDADESPLLILESKGYILPHIKRWLKQGGYTVDTAGYEQFRKDQSAKLSARAETYRPEHAKMLPTFQNLGKSLTLQGESWTK